MRLLLCSAVLAMATSACDNQPLPAGGDGGSPDLARTPNDLGRAPFDLGHTPGDHRTGDSQCGSTPPVGDCAIGGGGGGGGACSKDSDCTAGTNGRCAESMGGALFCACTYDSCTHDSDCPSNQLCACHGSPYVGGAGNTCVDGNCRVDADCGANGYCSPAHGTTGCGGLSGYYCHTASDQCINDSDCSSSSGLEVCTWSAANKRWECQQELLCA